MTDIVELIHAEHVRIGELIGKLDDALAAAWPAGTGSDPDPNADVCEAVKEAGMFPAGSQAWHMAVRAACSAVKIHITCMESGPLTQYQRHAAPAARHALGRE